MEDTSRIAGLEAALTELQRQQEEMAARLARSESAFRRWRIGVIASAALACLVLPPFAGSSSAARTPRVEKQVAVLEKAVFGVSPVPAGKRSKIARLSAALALETTERVSHVEGLRARIAPFFDRVSVEDGVDEGTEIVFTGVNLHVVSGSGRTDGPVNGLGNLIVGYNELRDGGDDRRGSNNLVVGARLNYSGFGGLLAGNGNEIKGEFCSITGGIDNTAEGLASSITGGTQNLAKGQTATVTGGVLNLGEGAFSAVHGGFGNTSSGQFSSVLGGDGVRVEAEKAHFP